METEIVLSKPVLLAEAVQRFRVLPVRVPGELDNEWPTDLPEVRAMSTANNCFNPTLHAVYANDNAIHILWMAWVASLD